MIRYTAADVRRRVTFAQAGGVPVGIQSINRPGGKHPTIFALRLGRDVVEVAGARAAYDVVDAWAKGYTAALHDFLDRVRGMR